MNFLHLRDIKQFVAIFLLTGLILLVPRSVSAQQQTGQVAPPTRNPQTNAPELFQQRENVQSAAPQNLLNQPAEIEIPTGTPVKQNNQNPDNNAARRIGLGLLSIVGVITAFKLLKKSQEIKDVIKPVQTSAPAKITETPEPTQVITSKVAPQKKKKNSKKKGKGKPRKKK